MFFDDWESHNASGSSCEVLEIQKMESFDTGVGKAEEPLSGGAHR